MEEAIVKEVEISIDIHTSSRREIVERLFIPAIYALLAEFPGAIKKGDVFKIILLKSKG